jgi:K+-sensing histidine kinase KdpD
VEHPEIDFATVLASAVHDMKNSLCMLIQSMDLLQQDLAPMSGNASQELARIHYEASRLNTNLMQLLSLYRIERDQLPLHLDEYFVEDLLEEVLIKNEMYSQQKQIQITMESDPQLSWFFDNDLISNLLNDMFVNALRYSAGKLLLKASIVEQQLCLELHDDGDGFPDYMLENSDTTMNQFNLTAGRTGLGLFFAQLIAKAHHNQGKTGRIELNNGGRFGGGVFRLYLP